MLCKIYSYITRKVFDRASLSFGYYKMQKWKRNLKIKNVVFISINGSHLFLYSINMDFIFTNYSYKSLIVDLKYPSLLVMRHM